MKRSLSLIGVYISVFTNSLMFKVVLPLASKMVMHFDMVDDRSETGYWVGLLGGSIMLGRFLSAPFWGWLCDHWGRRPTLLTGIVTTSLLALIFGISPGFYWALLFRFLQGLLSPIAVVARTVISELFASEDQASAMSWFVLMGSIGSIAGNIIGGFFDSTDGSSIQLFENYPFLLPNSLIAIFGIVSFILCFFFLDETYQQRDFDDCNNNKRFVDVIREPIVVQVTLLYIACTGNGTAFGELLVLWQWAKIKNGGFEFTTREIGTLSAITSMIYILYIKVLYKYLSDKLGITQLCKRTLFINIPLLLLIPLLTLARYTDVLKYIFISFSTLCYCSIEFMSITSSLLMINNSVYSKERGKLNGYTLALGNLARGLSPPVFSSVFAFTATSGHPYPLNFSFSFILLAISVFLAWNIARKLDDSLDYPKKIKLSECKELDQELVTVPVLDNRQNNIDRT